MLTPWMVLLLTHTDARAEEPVEPTPAPVEEAAPAEAPAEPPVEPLYAEEPVPEEDAAWYEDMGEPAPEGMAMEAGPALDVSQAEPLGRLSPNKLDFLKPKRSRLPQNPYGTVDFTAYSLEWGEWRVGLGSVMVGVLPRVQVGTALPLTAFGVYNASAKVNLLRLGPVDLAAGGHHYRLPKAGFLGTWTGLSGTASVRVLQPWSIHTTASWVDIAAKGSPELGQLPAMIISQTMGDPMEDAPQEAQDRADQKIENATYMVDATAQAVTLRLATDLRFNRRDSLIIQGSAMLWGKVDSDVNSSDLPPILGIDEALDEKREESLPIAETYIVSAAWQMQWKKLELRVGAGLSSVPGAWLVQSTDLAWRFGGKTKASERRMRTAWKQDRKDLRRKESGDSVAAATSEVEEALQEVEVSEEGRVTGDE